LIEKSEIQPQLFIYESFGLEYKIIGKGKETIICFHGFGRNADDFAIFQSLLGNHQRLVSVNLFAHGASQFPQERIEHQPLLPLEWKEVLEAFLAALTIESFHLLAYSMGGRIAMKTVELMPERVRSLLLLASDGFKKNKLYQFASGTAMGRKIYHGVIENPTTLFWWAKQLNRFGILNNKLHRFVHVHLDTHTKRQQVHDAWLIYRLFFSDLQYLADIIKKNEILFTMVFGKYDSVIRPRLGERFISKTGSTGNLIIIDEGHRLLTKSLLDFLKEEKLWFD